jgi:hypothetical protein
MTATASDAQRGSHPDRRRSCKARDAVLGVMVEDDSGTDETDSSNEPLNYATQRIGIRTYGRNSDDDDGRAAQAHQAMRAQPRRLVMQIAVDAENGADQDRSAEANYQIDRFQVRHALALRAE